MILSWCSRVGWNINVELVALPSCDTCNNRVPERFNYRYINYKRGAARFAPDNNESRHADDLVALDDLRFNVGFKRGHEIFRDRRSRVTRLSR